MTTIPDGHPSVKNYKQYIHGFSPSIAITFMAK